MRTFNLIEAAAFLKMTPEGLRRKAAKGEIPGAKPGKCWCFYEGDLVEHMRSLYPSQAKASWGVIERRNIWRSTKEVIPGGSQLTTKEIAYKKALGHPIK